MEVGLAGWPAVVKDEQLKQSVHVSASNLSRTGSPLLSDPATTGRPSPASY